MRYDGKSGLPEIDGARISIVRCSSGIVCGYGKGSELLREYAEEEKSKERKICGRATGLSTERDDVVFFFYEDAQRKIPGWLGIRVGDFMIPDFGLIYIKSKDKI